MSWHILRQHWMCFYLIMFTLSQWLKWTSYLITYSVSDSIVRLRVLKEFPVQCDKIILFRVWISICLNIQAINLDNRLILWLLAILGKIFLVAFSEIVALKLTCLNMIFPLEVRFWEKLSFCVNTGN